MQFGRRVPTGNYVPPGTMRRRANFKSTQRRHEEMIVEAWLLSEFEATGLITEKDRVMVHRLSEILPDLIFEGDYGDIRPQRPEYDRRRLHDRSEPVQADEHQNAGQTDGGILREPRRDLD